MGLSLGQFLYIYLEFECFLNGIHYGIRDRPTKNIFVSSSTSAVVFVYGENCFA